MKATLLGGWVRSYSISRTLLALTGALAFTACAEDARDTGITGGNATGTTAGTNGGVNAGTNTGSSAGTNNGGTGSNTNGATGTSGNGSTGSTGTDNTGSNGDADGGTTGVVDEADDPSTPGNDSPEATACTDTVSCGYASQSCCVSGVGDAECIDGNTCPAGGLIPAARTVCDGPEDCDGGKVCCVAVNPTGATNSCEDSCADVSGLIGVWQLCHTDDDCPSDKGSCAADDTFPFWGFCG